MTITLTDLLKQEGEGAYRLRKACSSWSTRTTSWAGSLQASKNWMTTGRCCTSWPMPAAFCVKGFVTGDWGMPAGAKPEDMKPEDMLPPAEKLPTVKSVDEALKLLADDKKTALKFIAEAGEKNLLTKTLTAPWGGPPMTLFQHIDHMIGHQGQHKAQLFYYLKLQGKDVNTGNLWGM